ncbi:MULTISPECIES: glycosyltransferase [unclassified Streptomyces]|uniref:glycosyltransferase n=1 Tax=unclassified Streptomyces TaxID=2593676 RepID=UPI0022536936|nr:nucleotide disphospho-sugar-binding domain-containing protein [Streptomyces sp. NBC_00338]MCX5141822.1 glycosyltransferase [Streptomyces sp. NBC_00338]
MATMLLVTHGSKGDVLPFIALGRALRGRGHTVRLLTHAVFGENVRSAGLDFVPIDTEEGYRRQQADEQSFLLGQLRGLDPDSVRAFYTRNQLFEHVGHELSVIAEYRDDPDVLVIGRHTSGQSGLMAKELYGLPLAWVSLTPSQPASMAATVLTHKTILADQLAALRARFGLAPVRDWEGWFDLPDLQLALWPRWFDRAGTPAPRSMQHAGFLLDNVSESGGLPDALARRLDGPPAEAPVLISGTSGGLGRDVFKTAAVRAAERLGRGAIVVGGTPDDLPAEVDWYPSLPFHEVMPKVAAAVHHGGVGTLARALSCGTPQVILAYNFDRPDNGRRLQARGLARWLPPKRWTQDAIEEALAAVLAAGPPADRYRPDFAASATAACTRLEALLTQRQEGRPCAVSA